MRGPQSSHQRAKRLRAELSLPEVLLWRRLKALSGSGPRFRRQHPIGPYVLDFYCTSAQLCVEIDGWAHATGDRPVRDSRRDRYLERLGIRVERIAAKAVLDDPDAVAAGLKLLATELSTDAARPLSQLR